MCTTSGRDCGTAETIFNKIDSVLSQLSIPWSLCVGFGVDNTSVNVGLHNSIMTRIKAYGMPMPPITQHWLSCL